MPTLRRRQRLERIPEILIFDVDGVLVDVRQSFWRSALETMRFLTGKRVTWAEFYKWKNNPGNNDDWSMVSNWATALGRPTTYEEARDAFQRFYWDCDGRPGNVRREKMLVTPKQVERWARRFELDLFTGRTRREFAYSFERWAGTRHFQILGKRDPGSALYLGDNVDDGLAAQAAGVPFMAILPRGASGYRQRAAQFRELGALALLSRAAEVSLWLR